MAIATPKNRIQLDLFDPTPERTVPGGESTPDKSLPTPHAWVEAYWVKRPSGKHEYFRFCHLKAPGDIRSVVRHHIPGGNTRSGVAQGRGAVIKLAIQCGDSVDAIAVRIQAWRAKKALKEERAGASNYTSINC